MIEITGLEELRAKLATLDQLVRTEFVVEAVKAGAAVIARAMKEEAPERVDLPSGDALPVGALKRGIRVRTHLDKDDFAVAKVGPAGRTAHIARLVEYGHENIKRDRDGTVKLHVAGGGMGKVIGHVPAHPFLRPAFERSEAAAVEAFKTTMWKELKGVK